VALQIGAIEPGRLGKVPLVEQFGIRGFLAFPHAVPVVKGLQLIVSPLEHGQDLRVRPRIHGNRSDPRGCHAVGPVPTGAYRAEQHPVR